MPMPPPDDEGLDVSLAFGLDADSTRRALERARELRRKRADAFARHQRSQFRVLKGGAGGDDHDPDDVPDAG